MEPTKRLAERIAAEAEAYGFSLTTWGVGALLVHQFGIPSIIGVMAYAIGAVLGYATLALVAFGGLFGRTEATDRPLVIASAIHIIATIGTLVFADVVIKVSTGLFDPVVVFAFGGYAMSTSYNVLLILEAVVARAVA